MSPTVSIIIPVYNSALYLQECLDSVFAQTFTDYEIICIDDGSTDDSLAILRDYQARHRAITIIESSNAGPAAARNLGIEAATGHYLLFLDSDDYTDHNLLQKAVTATMSTDADIVVWDVWYYNDKFNLPQNPPPNIVNFENYSSAGECFSWEDDPDQIFMSFQNWPWNKLFKASFVRENNISFQEGLYRTEDVMFVCPALVCAKRITCIKERLITYRVAREDSAMATKDPYAFDFIKAFTALRQFLVDNDIYQDVQRSYITWAADSMLYNLRTLNSFEAYKEVFDYLKSEGLAELGLDNIDPSLFFDDYYTDLEKHLESFKTMSREEFLFYLMKYYEASQADISSWLGIVEIERDSANQRLGTTAAILDRRTTELNEIMNAAEQKIGTAICRLPRAIQSAILRNKQA